MDSQLLGDTPLTVTSQWKDSIFVLGILLSAWSEGSRTGRRSPGQRRQIVEHGTEDRSIDGAFGFKNLTSNSNMSGTLGDIQTFIMQYVHVFMICLDMHNESESEEHIHTAFTLIIGCSCHWFGS